MTSTITTWPNISANALTRYVAADLQTPERRATMLGWIVWAGTIGAVVGPNLLSPSDRAGVSFGLPPLAGAYLVSGLIFLGAAALYVFLLRPDPSLLSVAAEAEMAAPTKTAVGTGHLIPCTTSSGIDRRAVAHTDNKDTRDEE